MMMAAPPPAIVACDFSTMCCEACNLAPLQQRDDMITAVLFTLLGFVFAIALGLIGAWTADHIGAFIGICSGLGFSFFATAYVAAR